MPMSVSFSGNRFAVDIPDDLFCVHLASIDVEIIAGIPRGAPFVQLLLRITLGAPPVPFPVFLENAVKIQIDVPHVILVPLMPIELLQFNYVHFRLTDDQTFNVKLDSWPQLAIPTPRHNQTKVYTPDQLRGLVQYAKARNITMIPEINVPGHAAGWANIPGLVIPCPEFACSKNSPCP